MTDWANKGNVMISEGQKLSLADKIIGLWKMKSFGPAIENRYFTEMTIQGLGGYTIISIPNTKTIELQTNGGTTAKIYETSKEIGYTIFVKGSGKTKLENFVKKLIFEIAATDYAAQSKVQDSAE